MAQSNGTAHNGTNLVTGQTYELLDRAFKDMNDALVGTLGWLDNAFGRAERLVKFDERRRRIYTPCWYTHGDQYEELTPTDTLGNFSFFWADDPQQVEWEHRQQVTLRVRFAWIVWLDFRTVYNGSNRNREQAKSDILAAFNGMTLSQGSFSITRVYELAENIYTGFSLDETDNQFLMSPYGGFRLEGELTIHANCIPTTTTTQQQS